jgi:hypothetical protein
MNRILHESKHFKLTEIRHRKQKKDSRKPVYEIKWHGIGAPFATAEEVRDVIDPLRNIGGHGARRWQFRDLKTAEKKYMMLVMRWA